MFKKPITHRFFILAALMVIWPLSAAQAQQPPASFVTEREAVQRALGRAPLRETLAGSIGIERGRSIAVRAYPNPQLIYLREQTFGSLGTGEDYLSIAQVIDVGGRRALNGEAVQARARAVESDAEGIRRNVAADARSRFFSLLHRQARTEALSKWVQRIDEALTIVRLREARGDAARYDLLRLERERAVAMARIEAERAAVERAQGHLAALTLLPATQLVANGDLMPEVEPPQLSELHAAGARRPELLALDERLHATTLEKKAAARFWLPDLRIEGGWKGVGYRTGGARSDGFLVSGTLTLPLWDHSHGVGQIADGEARAVRGRRLLLALEVDAELEGARAEAVRLRAASRTFRDQTSASSSELSRIAAAGYGGGELGLLELLDAYRGAAEDALTALDLELAAREARIEIDRLTGADFP
jgi:cobalt-zinc-cadmium efflux system outer membrane protein